MNYRLGAAAFLSHPALKESGNLALDDQREALRWVRRNISSFGGDPGNVTLMGQSGGGFAVCGHLASPASAGLFQRAILQSAPFSGTPTLPLPVDEALRTGRFNRVPVLLGVNHDEENGMILGLELATGKPMPVKDYRPAVEQAYGKRAAAVLKRYPLGESAGATLARVKTDATWSAPSLDTARTLSRWTSTRMFEFADRQTPWYAGYPKPSFPAAAQHMAELPYLFGLALFDRLTTRQAELGDRMIGAWTRFAATGDPNGGGEAAWPVLRDDRGEDAWHVQSLTGGAWKRADYVRDHGYRFWSALRK
ncbi:MAG: carboxylesterase family protein [Nonomuraea sp.]|nr:carboxylesterase family protein [Nonomuraea sp.]